MLTAIALGSNLASAFGPPEANVREAVRRLGGLGTVVAVSSLSVTDPVGYLDQPMFVNAAALLETERTPHDLLHALLGIEQAFGRRRDPALPKGPRALDLDLLLYGDMVLDTTDLTLPHPAMHERLFVLQPLAEIAPAMTHPMRGQSIAALLAALRPPPPR